MWIEKNQTAVIEVARACGMMMIAPEEKNPDIATSYGVGELILHALKKDCREIILTLGGTVSNDGGCGMLMALVERFWIKKENRFLLVQEGFLG